MQEDNDPRTTYIDTNQLAKLIGRSPHTLKRWRREGGYFPFYRIGGRIMYRVDEVERFIQDRRATSTAEEYSREEA